jgi:hypothetical protein
VILYCFVNTISGVIILPVVEPVIIPVSVTTPFIAVAPPLNPDKFI